MGFMTKTALFAQLLAKALARNITEEDLQDLFECTECGASLRLPTNDTSPASTPSVGTACGPSRCFRWLPPVRRHRTGAMA